MFKYLLPASFLVSVSVVIACNGHVASSEASGGGGTAGSAVCANVSGTWLTTGDCGHDDMQIAQSNCDLLVHWFDGYSGTVSGSSLTLDESNTPLACDAALSGNGTEMSGSCHGTKIDGGAYNCSFTAILSSPSTGQAGVDSGVTPNADAGGGGAVCSPKIEQGAFTSAPFDESCVHSTVCMDCRKMSATAANLEEHVMPRAPLRQWVLTMPFPWRRRLGYDGSLLCRLAASVPPPRFHTVRYADRGRRGARVRDA
jgi:hypothetical protein